MKNSGYIKNCVWCSERPIKKKLTMLCTQCYYFLILKTESNKKNKIEWPEDINLSSETCQLCLIKPTVQDKYALCASCQSIARKSNNLKKFKRTRERRYLAFLGKVQSKYTTKIFTDMESLRSNPYTHLSWLAEKYGVTREYIRQLHNKIYGEKYTSKVKEHSKLINLDISCNGDIRNYFALREVNGEKPSKYKMYEKLFIDECISRGFDVPQQCNGAVDFIVNGFNIDVKAATKKALLSQGSLTHHCRYSYTMKQAQKADFLACYHFGEKAFFIIPMRCVLSNKKDPTKLRKTGNGLFISYKKSNYHNSKNKYWEFKNAWYLLEIPQTLERAKPLTASGPA
jgi:hypothetical protein